MFNCLFVSLFVYRFFCFFCFNHRGTPTESSTENFVKIRLDLAEILTIRQLDWHEGGGEEMGREEGKESYFVMV